MIEPIPYREQKTDPVTWFMANCSLDGWNGAQWSRKISERLASDEILEFSKVVNEILKLCPEYNTLRKYFRKHGKQIRCDGMDPTLAFLIDRPLMTYMAETTGPNFWIQGHRKEKC